jgi:hypothetical protein
MLDTGSDVADMIAALSLALRFIIYVATYPEWYGFVVWLRSFFPSKGGHYIGGFVQGQIKEGMQAHPKEALLEEKSKPDDSFLTKVLRLHATDPERYDMDEVFATCQANIGAGSDTTSISLTAILYHLIRSPGSMQKVCPPLNIALPADCYNLAARRNPPKPQRQQSHELRSPRVQSHSETPLPPSCDQRSIADPHGTWFSTG